VNGPLSIELALAPENGNGYLVTDSVDGVRYLGTRFLVLREDAWNLKDADPLPIKGDMTSALVGIDQPTAEIPQLRIHPYFRWKLVDEHGLTAVPAGSVLPGTSGRWLLYDADTFVGVAAPTTADFGVGWATPLQRAKLIADVLAPGFADDSYDGYDQTTDWWTLWQYARLVDIALGGAR